MQTACWEMPWVRALRAVALMLAVVLGLEWTVPLGGYAQPNQEPASAPPTSVGNQDLPPLQKAESVETVLPPSRVAVIEDGNTTRSSPMDRAMLKRSVSSMVEVCFPSRLAVVAPRPDRIAGPVK